MSREREELRALARRERASAWSCAKRLPARAGDVASGFARVHPWLWIGGATAIALRLSARKRPSPVAERRFASWPVALTAIGARWLPDFLRMAGLSLPEESAPGNTPADPSSEAREGAH